MKKVLALVLSVLMVLSLSVVAFAEEVEAPETTPGSTDIDNADKKFELASAIWRNLLLTRILTNPALPITTPLWTRTMSPTC